jgi:Acetyltransferase (GNAT) domain
VLGPRCRVYGAFVDGRPAAAIVVLLGAAGAWLWRGAMDEELAGCTYANYLLHRIAIEDAAEAGCTAYHMGDSAPGSTLALFKSRFGALEQHYASYRLEKVAFGSLADRVRRRLSVTLRHRRGRE